MRKFLHEIHCGRLVCRVTIGMLLLLAQSANGNEFVGTERATAFASPAFPDRPANANEEQWMGLRTAIERSKLLPSPDGVGGPGGNFGYSVAVDGSRALVGGISLAASGAAIIFERSENGWVESAILRPSASGDFLRFGSSVSLSGDRALVGAPGQGGAAFVFDLEGSSWTETAVLTSNGSDPNQQFGISVSLKGDRALIGASRADANGTRSGAAYVFDFDGSTWTQSARPIPSDGEQDDQFGVSVSLGDDRALIGAAFNNEMGADSGAAYVFDLLGNTWAESTKLTAGDQSAGDEFGISVSLDGARALIGSHFHDDGGSAQGAAYIFDLNGVTWVESEKLIPGDDDIAISFGESVSLSGDRALLGASRANANGTDSGAAYFFDFDGTSWNETQKVVASDGESFDWFAKAVSLSGESALIGAFAEDEGGSGAGAAYLFDLDGAQWIESEKLAPSEGATDDRLGVSVSLSANRALVGATGDDDFGENSGAVYVFEFDGSSWTQAAKLTASNAGAGHQFGRSVSLLGNRALIGSSFDRDDETNVGAAYVFDFDGQSWTESANIVASDGEAFDFFGSTLSLDEDRALIGALGDDDNGSSAGAVYVFDYDGSSWNETVKLTPSDGSAWDLFGSSVSLRSNRALVGADSNDENGFDSGAAYVFDFDGTQWVETQKLSPSDGASSDHFGSSVSLAEDRALIGAPENDDNGLDSGSAYVFTFDGSVWTEDRKLLPSDGESNNEFGSSVALAGDRALVGGYFDEGPNGRVPGTAYVFEFDEKNWLETERILPSDSKAHDFFAFSVSLAGSRALVGSIGADDHGTDSGAAYIFSLNEPPMAKDDFFVTETDTQLSANVLTDNGNGPDSDPDNDPIEVTTIGVVAASGVGGTVEILADGTFFYTPPLNVAGLAFFTYAIGDPDGETSSATVTIDVGATRLFGDRFETD